MNVAASSTPHPDAQRAVHAVATVFDLLPATLLGRRRTPDVAQARFAAFAILRERGLTLTTIAGIFRRKDHGTIIHGVSRAAELSRHDPIYADALMRARTLLTPIPA